jgi:hypothetical protein
MLGILPGKGYPAFGVYGPSVPIPIFSGMNLELDDEHTTALIKELSDITENSRYPFSPRIRMVREILSKLRPEPVRERLPPPRTLRAPTS